MNKPIFLICTVGGSPDPVVKSLAHWQPDKICFVVSKESKQQLDEIKTGCAQATGHELTSNYDLVIVNDPQDLSGVVEKIRSLTSAVNVWNDRGGNFLVIVDITGGTKCMAAGLALVARRWPCEFSYVGGEKRDKDGVGVVQSGSERVVYTANPWEALGYQLIEDAVHLFNNRQYAAAAALLDKTIKGGCENDEYVKRQLTSIWHLARAYSAWDAFQHQEAAKAFASAIKVKNDLDAALRLSANDDDLYTTLQAHHHLCKQLAEDIKANKKVPTQLVIHELLANAERRAEDGRFDDGVARLYRATEAIAQGALGAHGLEDSGNLPLDKLPEPLKSQWKSKAKKGAVKIALQDNYTLLKALGDPLGSRFCELKLDDKKKSPLASRNNSILAHGFDPCSQATFQSMHKVIHQLAGLPDLSAFEFPKIQAS